MTTARMNGRELQGCREMAGMTPDEFAAALDVAPQELRDMEADRMPIPARFDDDVYVVADRAIRAMGFDET